MNNSNVDYVTLHYRSVLNDFSNQFLNEEFSDCVLNAEGKSLKVHRAMLCAQSSLLEKIVLEHRSIGDLCFIIEGVTFEDLKSVVQFMYNGSTNLTKKKVGSFLVVAELLGVKWLDRIQLLNDTEASKIDMNVANENEPSISNTVRDNTTETQSTSVTKSLACSVFKNLTNVLDSAIIKRKKHMKGEKHCKKSRCAKEDHKHEKKKHKMRHPFSHPSNTVETKEKVPGKETHLADMDENTFCTTLGLKKNNEVQPRELSSKSGPASVNTDTKIVAKSRSVPPLIKINREVKSNVESFESRDSNVIVSEINTLYIEDKNLSFLNIGANELCIRDNNIEIECDVLDASSSQFVIEKEETASIVELRDGNIIRAEFVDINPESTPIYAGSEDHKTQVTQPVVVLGVDDIVAPSSVISYPSHALNTSQVSDITVKVEENGESIADAGEKDKSCDEIAVPPSQEVCEVPKSVAVATNDNNPPSSTKTSDDVYENTSYIVDEDGGDVEQCIQPTGNNTGNAIQQRDEDGVESIPSIHNDVENTISPICVNDVNGSNVEESRILHIDEPLRNTPEKVHTADANREDNEQHETQTYECIEIASEEEIEADCGVEALPENGNRVEPPVNESLSHSVIVIRPSHAMKQPVYVVKVAQNMVDAVESVQQPVKTVETAQQPVRMVETAQQPVKMVETAQQPVRTVETAQQPLKTVETAQQPVKTVETAQQPVKTVETAQQPVKTVETTQQSVEAVDVAQNPATASETRSLLPLLEKATCSELVRKHFIAAKKLHSPFVYEKPCRKAKRGRPRKSFKASNEVAHRVEDQFQEYLDKTFDLKPFVIKLDKYGNEKDSKESEKMNFLSNFNLKRRGLSTGGQDHRRLRSNYPLRAMMHKKFTAIKTVAKNQIRKRSEMPPPKRAKLPRQTHCLANFKAVTVELEKLEDEGEGLRRRVIREHSYNVDPEERRESTDISLCM